MSDRAATGATVLAGSRAGLPVLAWTLPAAVAARLLADAGQHSAGLDRPMRPPRQGPAAAVITSPAAQ